MKNVPTNLRNLKSKVDKLEVDKLVPVSFNLSKMGDVLKNDGVRKDVQNAKIRIIEDDIPYITTLAPKTTLNTKTNEVKGKTPNIANIATTTTIALCYCCWK